jgi:hypothetical protein
VDNGLGAPFTASKNPAPCGKDVTHEVNFMLHYRRKELFVKRILFALAMFPIAIQACQCRGDIPTADRLNADYAENVFVGKVSRIVIVPTISPTSRTFRRKIFTLEVSSIFKGRQPRVVQIYGSYTGNCDSSDFILGHEYVIFAYRHPANEWLQIKDGQILGLPRPSEQILDTNSCTGTIDLSEANGRKILRELRQLTKAEQK